MRRLLACLFVVVSFLAARAAGELVITEDTYQHGEEKAPSWVVTNGYYRAVIVPAMGGRIVEWRDLTTGRDLVYDAGYGGLLDDHGHRLKMPYAFRWVERAPGLAIAELRLDEEVTYTKTVEFRAETPVLAVSYAIVNRAQEPVRLLFRNVVRPAGTEFTNGERYCFSTTDGLRHSPDMGRTDNLADAWCALVDPASQTAVAAAFEGDALARVYSWLGSKVAPTFEFMFRQLEAGRQVNLRYYWVVGHGLASVDFAHRDFLAAVDGAWDGQRLTGSLEVVPTWAPLADLRVTPVLSGADRQPLPAAAVPLAAAALGQVARLPLDLPAAVAGDYLIATFQLESAAFPAPILVEKAFPRQGNVKLLAGYQRPVRWLGEPVVEQPVPGWEKEVRYTIQPGDADRQRGWILFDETGDRAGQALDQLRFPLAQREYESFPVHVHSLSQAGTVTIDVESPALTVETFVPELVPETLWGRTFYGLKLIPGNTFDLKAGDDRVIYVRLHAGDLAPGDHAATLRFGIPGGEPLTLTVTGAVYPVRIPAQPAMVFDVNNAVNYLCATKAKGTNMDWDAGRATAFMSDMQTHGVRGQTLNGVNSLTAYYWYNRVKLRDDGRILTDAIKAEPGRFRDTLDLPDLDFSEWDWFVDQLLAYGQTHVRWPIGNCGTGFLQGHSQLTKLIYGKTFADGDLRQQVIQEWYYGQAIRYLRDRGIARIRVTIDDEIPSEQLAWWVQHAFRSIKMGAEPGVTQSAETVADDQRMNLVAPFMKHWIIGTLNRDQLAKRREQGIIRPEHWVTTYHSSANHWQPYDQMRGHCGLNPAYFDLDACWIQTYYRWNQSEAAIYHTDTGPLGSAAWEGARDGLEDGNFLLLARSLAAALPEAERAAARARIEAIVGPGEAATIRFVDAPSGVGVLTQLGHTTAKGEFRRGADTARFRLAKQQLLDLIAELSTRVPAQPAAADFGLEPVLREGRSLVAIPEGLPRLAEAQALLAAMAGPLAYTPSEAIAATPETPADLLFLGTLDELAAMPALARLPGVEDLSPNYPAGDQFVIRFVTQTLPAPPKTTPATRRVMLVICPTDAAVARALDRLPRIVRQPRHTYSTWIPAHHATP